MARLEKKKDTNYSCIGLVNPKNPLNVGAVLRAADCYNSKAVFYTGDRYMERSKADTAKAHKRILLSKTCSLQESIPFDCVPVAVDLVDKAKSLVTFEHPKRACYIFGPEDGTLTEEILSWCNHIVYIPTKDCMNLAATVQVVLYDRLAKEKKGEE